MIRTAECVTPKHPDKICDRISDAILNECLEQDPESRVAVETCGGHGKIFITGEISTNATLHIPQIAQRVYGGDIEVIVNIVKQSNFIAQGVDGGGAGDQGIMVGYACNENEELIPQELYLARQLCKMIYKRYPYDGKTQVTLENGNIKAVVVSFQNAAAKELYNMVAEWLELPWFGTSHPEIYCNPAGDWSMGGFEADAGVTGRKLVVDNYGPRIPIGGGAFSGKDASKVDRSAAYMARRIAVDILKEQNAVEVYVYLAYAIGHDQPVQATALIDGDEVKLNVDDKYDLSPEGIKAYLNLTTPIFEETAAWGHFGNGFIWS
jgi:S-adenosylmethionine synthetase